MMNRKLKERWSEIRQVIEIECRSQEHNQGKEDDHTADHLVDNQYAVVVKLVAYLVDQPCQAEPPQERSQDNAEETYAHLEGVGGDGKREQTVEENEQEHDHGV